MINDTRILILSYPAGNGYVRTIADFVNVMTSRGALCLDHSALYSRLGNRGAAYYIFDFISENGINCVIYLPSAFEFYFEVDFFEKLRKTNYMVMLAGEIETDYESRIRYYAQAMDLVFHSCFPAMGILSQLGVDSILYWGLYRPARYSLPDAAPKSIDVSFLGQLKEKHGRQALIDYLEASGIRVKTFGRDSESGVISEEEKIRVYKATKINLNFAGVNIRTRLTGSGTIHRRARQFKMNLFEAAFCGGFVLSEYVLGMENLFEIGKEIEVFRDKDELLEKVRYYLAHDDERRRIAARGRDRAHKDKRFDIEYAVPVFISEIDRRRNNKTYKPSEICLDPIFHKNYTSYRLWTASWFIKAGKWRLAFDELMTIIKRPVIDLYQLRIFLIEEVLDEFPKIKAFLKSLVER